MASEVSAGPSCSTDIKTMQLNDQKAGMQGLDKEAINKIIFETSKGTPYFTFQEKRQQRINQRIKEMFDVLRRFSESQRRDARDRMDALCSALDADRDLTRSIVHIDMDAFYAAVEMRDNPDLKSKPMAVGTSSMLSTSNYEARKYGVRAAMPGFIAKKLCPELIIVPCNFDQYRKVSQQIKKVIREYDPHSFAASLDEMYLDLTDHICELHHKEKHARFCVSSASTESSSTTDDGEPCSKTSKPSHENCPTCSRRIDDSIRDDLAFNIVKEIRYKIYEATGLTASAGIAPNMMLAKVCSDQRKPDGQYQIRSDAESVQEFIQTLPIKKISGIGPVQNQLLNAMGIYTCSDLHKKRDLVDLIFSRTSVYFYMQVGLGLGNTYVRSDYVRKSIGSEVTFKLMKDPVELHKKCQELCCEVIEDLKGHNLMTKLIVLKLKTIDFEVHTRNATLPLHTSDKEIITRTVRKLLDGEIKAVAPAPLTLRLIGIRMGNVIDEAQLAGDKQSKLEDFLRPRSSSEPEIETLIEMKPFTTYNCPICGAEVSSNVMVFNKHVDQCLSNPVLSRIASGDDDSGLSGGTETKKEVPFLIGLTCPICGVEQKSNELADFNAHIDICLNRAAIKELLSTEPPAKISAGKRKRSSGGKSGKQAKDEAQMLKIPHYFR